MGGQRCRSGRWWSERAPCSVQTGTANRRRKPQKITKNTPKPHLCFWGELRDGGGFGARSSPVYRAQPGPPGAAVRDATAPIPCGFRPVWCRRRGFVPKKTRGFVFAARKKPVQGVGGDARPPLVTSLSRGVAGCSWVSGASAGAAPKIKVFWWVGWWDGRRIPTSFATERFERLFPGFGGGGKACVRGRGANPL